jgi:hypothetical protein
LDGERLHVSWSTKPATFGVQEILIQPGDAGVIARVGAPSVCTAWGKTQKPPVTENCPLVMLGPASAWPMVPDS